jgi:hypothetical protein
MMHLPGGNWTWLEIAKLVVSFLTPVAIGLFSLYLRRLSRRMEDRQWVNQKVVEKRLEIYDQLAPQLNDVLCYFTFVGCWKDFDPPAMVEMKRSLDRKIHLAKPLFPAGFFVACQLFLRECFTRFSGPWGSDAQLRTTMDARIKAHPRPWQSNWADHFSKDHADPYKVQELYKDVMREFSACLGQLDFTPSESLSRLPPDLYEDAMRKAVVAVKLKETAVDVSDESMKSGG